MADIEAVNKIPIVPQLLDLICSTTKMRFAAIARVTENKWITCTSKDEISFGLKKGDELEIETTLCQTVRDTNKPIFIDCAAQDPEYSEHPTPKLYNISGYVSYPIIRRDGSFFGTLCAIDSRPARVKTKEVMGLFKMFADLLSFHLEAVEEVRTTSQRLAEERHNSELREQFIAILGHDLRNPIATSRMSAEILLHTSKDETVRKHAGMIKSTSHRMQGLIENILDFARGRLGEGITLRRERNSDRLVETIQQVVKEIRIISPNRQIEVNIKLEEQVPCDQERVGQLLSNLLSNADSHGATDRPIRVEVYTKAGNFILSVYNHGEKIPEAAMKHLFQPFSREDVKPGKQGLGLGLYITHEIARAHGGRIQVRSTDEETCFTFSMPIV